MYVKSSKVIPRSLHYKFSELQKIFSFNIKKIKKYMAHVNWHNWIKL